MAEEKSLLQVMEQKTVVFYADELVAVRAADGHIYVSLRHLCQALGIDPQAQTRRIQRQKVLHNGLQSAMITTPTRGDQQAYVLRVDLTPLFLAGVSTRAVQAEVRPKLEQFQQEAAKVLWEAFQEGRLTSPLSLTEEALLARETPAAQAYQMALAIVKMARNQALLEAQLEAQRQELTTHTAELQAHAVRLEQLENAFRPATPHITDAQASQISQAVRAVGLELSRRSGRNEYGGVYGELYRRFGITSYKLLPAGRFAEAMNFLTQWYQSLTGETDLPF